MGSRWAGPFRLSRAFLEEAGAIKPVLMELEPEPVKTPRSRESGSRDQGLFRGIWSWSRLKKFLRKLLLWSICSSLIYEQCTLYSRHNQYWLLSYLKFLVAQKCIEKDLDIYIFFNLKIVIVIFRFTIDTFYVHHCSVLTQQ